MNVRHAGCLVGWTLVPVLVLAVDWEQLDEWCEQHRDLERARAPLAAAWRAGCQRYAEEAAEVAKARDGVRKAEEQWQRTVDSLALRELWVRRQEAIERLDAAVERLAAESATWRRARELEQALRARQKELLARAPELGADEWRELGFIHMELGDLSARLRGALRAWRWRGEVADLYRAHEEAEKAWQQALRQHAELKRADDELTEARRALAAQTEHLRPPWPALRELRALLEGHERQLDELTQRIERADDELLAADELGVVRQVRHPRRDEEIEKKVDVTLPRRARPFRGMLVIHPLASRILRAPEIRRAAVRHHLAWMVFDLFDRDPDRSWEHIDGVLEEVAERAAAPELRGAPILFAGLSAGVLGPRDAACARPDRTLGVIHIAGGNFQEMPESGAPLAGVPFLAINGEFEWCGPAGGGQPSGRAGIRPQYGRQTQWVMIREQMLRLWRGRHAHPMALVVIPNGDHGDWDGPLIALFIRKVMDYRWDPEGHRPPAPARCRPVAIDKGWLTDADLDHPRFEPAPYGEFSGDRDHAFWHFDGEMARAVYEFHRGRFILPDPTKAFPVPADWPRMDR